MGHIRSIFRYAHGREELRSVPRLTDRHPTATLEAINQVIECLPVSRSRDVAMSKGQQLYQQLVMQKGDSVELFGLQPEFVSPHNVSIWLSFFVTLARLGSNGATEFLLLPDGSPRFPASALHDRFEPGTNPLL